MRVYGKLSVGSSSEGTRNTNRGRNEDDDDATELQVDPSEARHIRARSSITVVIDNDQQPLRDAWTKPGMTFDVHHQQSSSHVESLKSQPSVLQSRPDNTPTSADQARKKALKKMLLLNGYPILYIILWIPGIANRIAEGVGSSPTWLKVLQASTQLVGLANAATYAYNEQLLRRIREGKPFKRLVMNR